MKTQLQNDFFIKKSQDYNPAIHIMKKLDETENGFDRDEEIRISREKYPYDPLFRQKNLL